MYIVIALMCLVIAFMTLVGVILGLVGSSTFDTPSTRGDLSELGGRILIGVSMKYTVNITAIETISAPSSFASLVRIILFAEAPVFSVLCALFVNIVVAVVFVTGANTAIVCRSASDLQLLKHVSQSRNISFEIRSI